MKNSVFIATSIDGFIADKEGKIDWLHSIPNDEQEDMGYAAFIAGIDALLLGRKTFETVLNFDIPWPYEQPVFVLSNSLKVVPKALKSKVFIVNGKLPDILTRIHNQGFKYVYIDGGSCIQSCFKENLIDEMFLTTIPVLLGGGAPLFSEIRSLLNFELLESKVFLNQVCQRHYKRKRKAFY